MAKLRLSTTVDEHLLTRARGLAPGRSDASMVERALLALLTQHRRTEIDAAYSRAYGEHPVDEPDAWGDLASFGEAAGTR
jgi:hypothetical protein